MAYGAPPPYYGPPPGQAPAPYGMPPPASPPQMAPPPYAPAPVVHMPPPAGEKPPGVMLISILTFVQGAILMAIAAYLIIFASVFAALPFFGALIATICIAIAVIFILIGVIFFVLGWGLMTLKPWARRITLILTIISVILNLMSALGGNYIGILEVLVGIVVIFYLTRPNIKAAFEPPRVLMGPPPMMVGGMAPPAYGPPPPMYPPQAPPPGYGPPPQAPPHY